MITMPPSRSFAVAVEARFRRRYQCEALGITMVCVLPVPGMTRAVWRHLLVRRKRGCSQ
jgi:hypothetical protein